MRYICHLLLATVFICVVSLQTVAQGISILRDAETEAFLNKIGVPIFEAANLNPGDVKIHLVNDNSINAFVTGGQQIFFHSGLILRMDNVDELHGVMAHETGHISGGHAVRTKEAFSKAGNFSIASMILGAIAIAAGSPDAGMAMMMAGQQATLGTMLSYSRTQEASTDQAGALFLQRSGISGQGFISFFRKLQAEEMAYRVTQNPYMRTHPLTRDRIMKLSDVVQKSPHFNKPPDPQLNSEFTRIQAKLEGYIRPSDYTLNKYPLTNQTVEAKYARIYAYHKSLEWDKAISEIDDLIKLEPENPYFYEIKGQVMFESGQLEAALIPFKKATELAPDSALILTAYAQALLAIEDGGKPYKQTNVDKALPILKEATRLDSENAFAWFNLAKVYSYLDMPEYAALATAERYFSVGYMSGAYHHANRAKEQLKFGSIEWLRADDIVMIAGLSVSDEQRQMETQRRGGNRGGNRSGDRSQRRVQQ